MRRDHRPYWLKQWQGRRNDAWSRRHLHPQFDAVGPDCVFINPRQVEIIGPNIRIGRQCQAAVGTETEAEGEIIHAANSLSLASRYCFTAG